AVFFRDQSGEKSRLGQCRDEFVRIGALAIERAPVFAGEVGTQRPHRFADRREIGAMTGMRLVRGHDCIRLKRTILHLSRLRGRSAREARREGACGGKVCASLEAAGPLPTLPRRRGRDFAAYALISARPLLMAITSRSTTRERKLTTAPSRHISVR